jgi:alkaline phosphatase
MLKKKLNTLLILSITLGLISCSKQLPEMPPEDPTPKNIILLIGDGMGLSQVSTAFFYQEKEPNFQRFETVGLIKTSSSAQKITDSAAAGTAFSAGVKTYNGAIGVNPDTVSVETIVEIASAKGMKTGLIATSSITHATPASFFAHVKLRGMQDEIAAWMPTSGVDYFAGGGLKYFNQRKDEIDYIKKLEENGFVVDTTELVTNAQLTQDKKYGYLLAADGMPKISEGRGDFLPNATAQALSYLSQSEEGFFLMVEGSQIDWGGHANDADYLVNELLDFDKTLGVALDFAEREGNTLVVVTADHETGGLTLASGEGYNDIELSFSTGGHSATLIPVFAHGPGSDKFTGTYENTEIFHKMIKSLMKTK